MLDRRGRERGGEREGKGTGWMEGRRVYNGVLGVGWWTDIYRCDGWTKTRECFTKTWMGDHGWTSEGWVIAEGNDQGLSSIQAPYLCLYNDRYSMHIQ